MDPRTRRGFKMWYLVYTAFYLALVIFFFIDIIKDVMKNSPRWAILLDAMLIAASIMFVIRNLEIYFTRT